MSSRRLCLQKHQPDSLSLQTRRDFGSPLHMASLHKHCLKNANRKPITHGPSTNIASKTRIGSPLHMAPPQTLPQKRESEAHYAWPASTPHITRLRKPIIYGQPLQTQHDFGSPLHMASLHSTYQTQRDFGSPLRRVSFHLN